MQTLLLALADRLMIQKKRIALAIHAVTLVMAVGVFFFGELESSGNIAQYTLLFILYIRPLADLTGHKFLRALVLYRKEFGIMMGVFAIVHSLTFFSEAQLSFVLTRAFWIENGFISQYALGFLALLLTIPLLVTSNLFSMKLLGPLWKKLHYLVYPLLILTALHVVAVEHGEVGAIAFTASYVGLYGVLFYLARKRKMALRKQA